MTFLYPKPSASVLQICWCLHFWTWTWNNPVLWKIWMHICHDWLNLNSDCFSSRFWFSTTFRPWGGPGHLWGSCSKTLQWQRSNILFHSQIFRQIDLIEKRQQKSTFQTISDSDVTSSSFKIYFLINKKNELISDLISGQDIWETLWTWDKCVTQCEMFARSQSSVSCRGIMVAH